MSISQPAASRVLAQLRHATGDPLLVRGRHGNTLTPRGESLRPAVAEALEAISSLFEHEVFEPSNTKLLVRVAATDNGATVVLAPLVQSLATLAPGVTVLPHNSSLRDGLAAPVYHVITSHVRPRLLIRTDHDRP